MICARQSRGWQVPRGTPYRRDYRFLEAEGVLEVRSDRRDFRPYGLYGGYPGKPSWNYLNPDEENCLLPSKVTMTIPRGTVFRHEVAGARGWGDPLERDPAAVLKDVRNELVSLTAARELYGVIDASTWTVEAERTQQLRAALRAARGWTELRSSSGRAAPPFCCSRLARVCATVATA